MCYLKFSILIDAILLVKMCLVTWMGLVMSKRLFSLLGRTQDMQTGRWFGMCWVKSQLTHVLVTEESIFCEDNVLSYFISSQMWTDSGRRQTGVHGGMRGSTFGISPSNACPTSRPDADEHIEIGNCRGNLTCLILPFQFSCVTWDIYFPHYT
jgi:hypothetical protein